MLSSSNSKTLPVTSSHNAATQHHVPTLGVTLDISSQYFAILLSKVGSFWLARQLELAHYTS
jgi:hypothetical protein